VSRATCAAARTKAFEKCISRLGHGATSDQNAADWDRSKLAPTVRLVRNVANGTKLL